MSYFANDLMGASIIAPSTEQMSDLLRSLASADSEHPDVSLGHESGWSISAFSSGLTVLENVETGEGPMHMRGVAQERILELWSMLAAGNISGLSGLAWAPGYGTSNMIPPAEEESGRISIEVPDGVIGDVEAALVRAGLPWPENSELAAFILSSTGVISFKLSRLAELGVDAAMLAQELRNTGLSVGWTGATGPAA